MDVGTSRDRQRLDRASQSYGHKFARGMAALLTRKAPNKRRCRRSNSMTDNLCLGPVSRVSVGSFGLLLHARAASANSAVAQGFWTVPDSRQRVRLGLFAARRQRRGREVETTAELSATHAKDRLPASSFIVHYRRNPPPPNPSELR